MTKEITQKHQEPRITHALDSLAVGGAERMVLRFLAHCDAETARIVVVTRRDTLFEEQAALLPIPLSYLSHGRLFSWRTWRSAHAILNARADHVLHAHMQHATLIFLPLAKLAGMKTVVTLHNVSRPAKSLSARLRNALERLVLRRFADLIISVGSSVTRAWQGVLPGHAIVTMPNTVPMPESLAPRDRVRAGIGAAPDAPVFISVASLSVQKNTSGLINAFQGVLRDHPSAELWLVGHGSLRKALEAQVDAQGLGAHVRFLGNRSDVNDLLGASDVFVLASDWEGLPLAMLEAMACGLPVVVTAVGDIPTVANPGNAVIVPPGDGAALRQAMSDLAGDTERRQRLGRAARAKVETDHNETRWVAELRQLYRDLAAPR
ncbi:glycosyltransferase [Primorskyibacter aestuariivivens]|uniref:glycosyltransferase n=1 Tax=Primorskyibacter aestuariivivens TaxID=1888912 RepID=UPI00230064D4|nr:glycosyltransferase [Primorskyibacter aestuariivivens]MDA7429633.1 glycosyltransferase [Primorskyibacter aestuariivivens]